MAPMTPVHQERPMSLAQRAASHLDCFRILQITAPFYLFFLQNTSAKYHFVAKKLLS